MESLQAIAIIQLYLEERWIEPIPQLRCPFSLLYHQTMSILASVGETFSASASKPSLDPLAFQVRSHRRFQGTTVTLA